MPESTSSYPPSIRDNINKQPRGSRGEYMDLATVAKDVDRLTAEAHKQIADGMEGGLSAMTDDIYEPCRFAENQSAANEDAEREIENSLIYLVDDQEMLTDVLKDLLDMVGFKKLKTFSDGDEVKAAIFGNDGDIKELPSLIISDTEMARMNGPELYRILQSLPEEKRPAVLATSGRDSSRELWGKSVPFLPKPYDFMEMENAVRRLLTEKFVKPSK